MLHALANFVLRRRTVAAWAIDYDQIIAARPLGAKTLQNRRKNIAHLQASLGGRLLRDVRPLDVSRVVRQLWDAGLHFTARRVLIEARDLFNEAVLAGELHTNPAVAIQPLPAPVQRSRLAFEHWQQIHAWVAQHGRPWFAYALRLALVCGQRRADLVAMSTDDVWDEHLHVVQQKTGARVALPLALHLDALGATLGQVIAEAQDYREAGSMLLRQRANRPFGTAALSASFARARDAVFPRETWGDRTPPTFHEIRSLSERLYRAQGIDTKTLLGHKRQSMTDQYNDDRGLTRGAWKTLVI